MKCVVQLAVVVALLGSTLASGDPVCNVTSGVEDYTRLVGRSMQAKLELAALKLATVKLRHADRLQSIVNQQQMVIQEVLQFDSSMVQHQALSLNRKHCVQKHKPFVPTVREVDQNFTQCIHSAESGANRFTEDAETHLSRAKQIREEEVPGIYSNCMSVFLQVDDCVSQAVDEQLVHFNGHMDKFEINLQEGLYSSSIIAAEATRCSFAVQKRVLASNGGALSLFDVCTEQLQAHGRLDVGLSARHIVERKLMERLRAGGGSLEEFV